MTSFRAQAITMQRGKWKQRRGTCGCVHKPCSLCMLWAQREKPTWGNDVNRFPIEGLRESLGCSPLFNMFRAEWNVNDDQLMGHVLQCNAWNMKRLKRCVKLLLKNIPSYCKREPWQVLTPNSSGAFRCYISCRTYLLVTVLYRNPDNHRDNYRQVFQRLAKKQHTSGKIMFKATLQSTGALSLRKVYRGRPLLVIIVFAGLHWGPGTGSAEFCGPSAKKLPSNFKRRHKSNTVAKHNKIIALNTSEV